MRHIQNVTMFSWLHEFHIINNSNMSDVTWNPLKLLWKHFFWFLSWLSWILFCIAQFLTDRLTDVKLLPKRKRKRNNIKQRTHNHGSLWSWSVCYVPTVMLVVDWSVGVCICLCVPEFAHKATDDQCTFQHGKGMNHGLSLVVSNRRRTDVFWKLVHCHSNHETPEENIWLCSFNTVNFTVKPFKIILTYAK